MKLVRRWRSMSRKQRRPSTDLRSEVATEDVVCVEGIPLPPMPPTDLRSEMASTPMDIESLRIAADLRLRITVATQGHIERMTELDGWVARAKAVAPYVLICTGLATVSLGVASSNAAVYILGIALGGSGGLTIAVQLTIWTPPPTKP